MFQHYIEVALSVTEKVAAGMVARLFTQAQGLCSAAGGSSG